MLILGSRPTSAALAQDLWDQANAATLRLPPSAFPELPTPVREALVARGCRIPQSYSHQRPHNVIRGQFTRAGRFDWAVLCSRNDTSRILVFRNGLASEVDELDPVPDKTYLQTISGAGRIGYSRFISVAEPETIRKHHRWHGGPTPPPLDHHGIDVAFLGKASHVWYWHA